MNLEDIRMAYNRMEPGQSPGEQRTKMILFVLGVGVVLGILYYLCPKPTIIRKPDEKGG